MGKNVTKSHDGARWKPDAEGVSSSFQLLLKSTLAYGK
jgi:hypothetical protein